MSRLKESRWARLIDISIDPSRGIPISRQIYLQLRQAIVERTLTAGSAIPSSRELARRLAVSRTSVIAAFEELYAEGLIEGQRGSGTFVCPMSDDPVTTLRAGAMRRTTTASPAGPASFPPSPLPPASPPPQARRISRAGTQFRQIAADGTHQPARAFALGRCTIDEYTREAWRRISARHQRRFATDVSGYSDPFGRWSFREVVAEYLRAFRGVRCTPEQLLITAGAQQGIDLAIRVLLDPGDAVWVEDPGYPSTQQALRAAGIRAVPVPVDGLGMQIDIGLEREPRPRAIFVTPSHQYPTGAVMDQARRARLLEVAAATGAWIVEDDYDREFRYAGDPKPSLQGVDHAARVIYIGTLSKVLTPTVRTGFAVVPSDLIDAFRGARHVSDRFPPLFEHQVIEEFMREGYFSSHVQRTRGHYQRVRRQVVDDLQATLGPWVQIAMPDGGMHVVAYLAAGLSDRLVAREAMRHDVAVRPLSPLYLDVAPRQGLDIGFTGYPERELRSAAVRLGDAVRQAASDAGLSPRPIDQATLAGSANRVT